MNGWSIYDQFPALWGPVIHYQAMLRIWSPLVVRRYVFTVKVKGRLRRSKVARAA